MAILLRTFRHLAHSKSHTCFAWRIPHTLAYVTNLSPPCHALVVLLCHAVDVRTSFCHALVSEWSRDCLQSNQDNVHFFQDSFTVFDPKQLRRKGKERHIFLFEQALLFSKETKDAEGKIKYLYKNKLKVKWQYFVVQQRLTEKPHPEHGMRNVGRLKSY